MHIIKDGEIVPDAWSHLPDDEPLKSGHTTVSLQRWLDERDTLLSSGKPIGLRVHGEDSPTQFCEDLARLPLICIDIPSMSDGRGFSLARLLRERYGFGGELRVRGDFIRDQMYFLARVGVNAFELPQDADLPGYLAALQDFTVKYQASTDEPLPLFRRR